MSLADRALQFLAAVDGQWGRLIARPLMRGTARRNRLSTQPVIGDGAAIVSLTTYGTRLATVHHTLESIGRGSVRPARLILWVDAGTPLDTLPAELHRLQRRGLEILPTRDIGPYKKIIPTLAEAAASHPAAPIVTADDDVIYPRDWLATLLRRGAAEPGLMHCYRARRIELDDSGLAPYQRWRLCTSREPSYRHIATGVSGSYYPPELQRALRDAGDAFLEAAPRADDLWAHFTAVTHGVRIRQVGRRPRHFPEIPGSQRESLFASNLRRGANDPQIAATYTAEAVALIRQDAAR